MILRVLATCLALTAAAAAAEDQPLRERGTLPEDWLYELPEGVTSRGVTYYSDEIACYAKLFFPPGFTTDRTYAGVVLGHGYAGMHHGIEKHGARFAERGLIAMVIDYRSWGYSDGYVSLLDPDTTTDDQRFTEQYARIQIKRTRLISHYQVEDYRNAISFLQGEPGVDPDRIGVWGSSHSGGHVVSVSALDARVKAAVGQVPAIGGKNRARGPVPLRDALIDDAIQRARTGQGGQIEVGFSWRRTVDLETRQVGSEYRPFHYVDRVPETTAILFIVAENEELFNNQDHAYAASKLLKGPSEVLEVPGISHFQMYSGPAFEIASNAAADWFLKHLK